MDEEQEVFDVEFTYIAECDRTLDEVIASLAAAGVRVRQEQRHIVARWLDMFSVNSPVPLSHRLAMLRGMLRGTLV